MSEWKEYKLGEVSESVSYGYTESANEKPVGPKFLRITDIREGSINWDKVPYCIINQKEYLKNKIEIGDIVVARTGATTGITEIIKHKVNAVFASYLIRFRINTKLANPFYVGHVLKSHFWKDYVSSIVGGSAQPGANAKQFSEFSFKAPNLSTQKSIAEVLSSIDDKIELNNKINQELETLAQLLFKQWFIDFEFPNENGEPYKSSGGKMMDSELGEIPKGWQVGSIYDISSVIYGAPFKSSLFNQENIGFPLIRIRDLKTFKPQNWTEEVHPKGTKIYPGDLIVGMDAEFRPHFWLGQEGWLNQRVCLFKPKDKFARLFVRETIRPRLEFYENSSVGTTVIHLGKGDIDTFKSLLPKSSISKLFTELTEPLIDKIILNSQESETLRKTRDYILPKLISGELQINDN